MNLKYISDCYCENDSSIHNYIVLSEEEKEDLEAQDTQNKMSNAEIHTPVKKMRKNGDSIKDITNLKGHKGKVLTDREAEENLENKMNGSKKLTDNMIQYYLQGIACNSSTNENKKQKKKLPVTIEENIDLFDNNGSQDTYIKRRRNKCEKNQQANNTVPKFIENLRKSIDKEFKSNKQIDRNRSDVGNENEITQNGKIQVANQNIEKNHKLPNIVTPIARRTRRKSSSNTICDITDHEDTRQVNLPTTRSKSKRIVTSSLTRDCDVDVCIGCRELQPQKSMFVGVQKAKRKVNKLEEATKKSEDRDLNVEQNLSKVSNVKVSKVTFNSSDSNLTEIAPPQNMLTFNEIVGKFGEFLCVHYVVMKNFKDVQQEIFKLPFPSSDKNVHTTNYKETMMSYLHSLNKWFIKFCDGVSNASIDAERFVKEVKRKVESKIDINCTVFTIHKAIKVYTSQTSNKNLFHTLDEYFKELNNKPIEIVDDDSSEEILELDTLVGTSNSSHNEDVTTTPNTGDKEISENYQKEI